MSLHFLLVGCAQENEESKRIERTEVMLTVPDTLVEKSTLAYDHYTSTWTLDDSPYSGYVVSYHPDKSLKEKFGVLAGKKQNESIEWFSDGHYKTVSDYHKGKLHGEKRLWAEDSTHILIAHFNYHTGKPHGEQRKWYPNGKLFKKLNLNMGKEQGLQQAFRENGDLYANYEAREGRIFGLKKASLCYSLEDEQILTPKD